MTKYIVAVKFGQNGPSSFIITTIEVEPTIYIIIHYAVSGTHLFMIVYFEMKQKNIRILAFIFELFIAAHCVKDLVRSVMLHQSSYFEGESSRGIFQSFDLRRLPIFRSALCSLLLSFSWSCWSSLALSMLFNTQKMRTQKERETQTLMRVVKKIMFLSSFVFF